jgi:large subunit ribosomal protein L17
MRHRVAFRKLGRVTSHRIATLRALASALFERERIQTTLMKAKELRPYAERLITLAKRDEGRLHARRQVARDIQNGEVVKKLFDSLGARYSSRPGGYTRILRLGPRKGDGAEMAIVELLGSEYSPEKKAKEPKKVAEPKPAAKAPRAAKKKDAGEGAEKKTAKAPKAKAGTSKKTATAAE